MMPRTTLKQQWDALKSELQCKEDEYVSSLFDGALPTNVFEVGRMGTIETWRVSHASLGHPIKVYFWGKSPKRQDVSTLKHYVNNLPDFSSLQIFLHMEQDDMACNVSRCVPLSQIEQETRYFFNEPEAQAKASEIKERLKKENELLASGHIRCQYCGKVRPPDQIHYKSIIAVQYRNLHSDPRPYCKDKSCAAYDQMGHEG